MQAFHDDPAIRDKYINRVKAHREADELVQGVGFDGKKGCAVGCTFDKYNHSCGPVEIGFPVVLMHLNDAIFEGLDKTAAMAWPERFLSAPRLGADLSLVWAKFAVWLLVDPMNGVIRFASPESQPCIEAVARLWQRVVDGASIESLASEFAAAVAEARAAEAGAWAVRSWAEVRAASHYQKMADKLIEIMEAENATN
jgi:hypothetical protein